MLLLNHELQEGWKRFPHLMSLHETTMGTLAALMGYKPRRKPGRPHMNFGIVPANPSAAELSPGDTACNAYVRARQALKATRKKSDRDAIVSAENSVAAAKAELTRVVKATRGYRFDGIAYTAFIDRAGDLHCCERPASLARRYPPALVA